MANCSLNRNILKGDNCAYSLPKIVDIYLANYNDVSATTKTEDCDPTSGGTEITAISMVSGAKFYHIEAQKNSINYTDELVLNDNGSKYRTHTISFTLPGGYNKDMVCSVDALALGRFIAVVVTGDGQWLMLGRGVGLEANAQSIAGGNDSNGVTVTLAADVAESSLPLNDTAIATVKG